MTESSIIIGLSAFSLAALLALQAVLYRNNQIKTELTEAKEINESLKNEVKFQVKVNKTLREGLEAITNKNKNVK